MVSSKVRGWGAREARAPAAGACATSLYPPSLTAAAVSCASGAAAAGWGATLAPLEPARAATSDAFSTPAAVALAAVDVSAGGRGACPFQLSAHGWAARGRFGVRARLPART